MTRDYVSVVYVGIGFVFLYNFFSCLLRAMGNSIVPLLFLAVSAGMNIVLDIWFVVGFHMGVGGAAWATVVGQAASGVGIRREEVIGRCNISMRLSWAASSAHSARF